MSNTEEQQPNSSTSHDVDPPSGGKRFMSKWTDLKSTLTKTGRQFAEALKTGRWPSKPPIDPLVTYDDPEAQRTADAVVAWQIPRLLKAINNQPKSKDVIGNIEKAENSQDKIKEWRRMTLVGGSLLKLKSALEHIAGISNDVVSHRADPKLIREGMANAVTYAQELLNRDIDGKHTLCQLCDFAFVNKKWPQKEQEDTKSNEEQQEHEEPDWEKIVEAFKAVFDQDIPKMNERLETHLDELNVDLSNQKREQFIRVARTVRWGIVKVMNMQDEVVNTLRNADQQTLSKMAEEGSGPLRTMTQTLNQIYKIGDLVDRSLLSEELIAMGDKAQKTLESDMAGGFKFRELGDLELYLKPADTKEQPKFDFDNLERRGEIADSVEHAIKNEFPKFLAAFDKALAIDRRELRALDRELYKASNAFHDAQKRQHDVKRSLAPPSFPKRLWSKKSKSATPPGNIADTFNTLQTAYDTIVSLEGKFSAVLPDHVAPLIPSAREKMEKDFSHGVQLQDLCDSDRLNEKLSTLTTKQRREVAKCVEKDFQALSAEFTRVIDPLISKPNRPLSVHLDEPFNSLFENTPLKMSWSTLLLPDETKATIYEQAESRHEKISANLPQNGDAPPQRFPEDPPAQRLEDQNRERFSVELYHDGNDKYPDAVGLLTAEIQANRNGSDSNVRKGTMVLVDPALLSSETRNEIKTNGSSRISGSVKDRIVKLDAPGHRQDSSTQRNVRSR